MKNFVQRLEPLGGGDARGVEHQPAELVGPASADVVAHDLVVVGQGGTQGFSHPALAADQQGSGQCRLTCLVAPQLLGLRYAELLGQERTGP